VPHTEPTTIQSFSSTLTNTLHDFFVRWTNPDCLLPTSLLDLEHHLAALLRSFHDLLVSLILSFWLSSTSLLAATTKAYCDSKPNTYCKGKRTVSLTFLGGHTHDFRIPFIARRRTGPGRKRASGKRGASRGLTCYPVLQALGFVGKYSPAAASTRGLAAVSSCSFLAAREQLAPLGLDSGQRSLLKSVDELGSLCIGQLDQWLDEPSAFESPWGKSFDITDKTLVITLDGGRARLRIPKPGRPKANGHHDFEAPWVEPRLFSIYIADDKGKQDKRFGKLSDGGLRDADQLVAQLARYLVALNVGCAAQVVVVADGAPWIWARLRTTLLGLGVDGDKIMEVLDFYHASQHIHEAAKAQQNWSQGCCIKWCKLQVDRLVQGDVAEVIAACDKLFREERREEMEKLANYLENNQHRCRYDVFRLAQAPCGSGVIESLVKQVICMRVKGCGKFWKRANCEQMVRLRSWLVSGRLEALMNWALARRASWWHGEVKLMFRHHKNAA
jgi:hypothetical protein